MTPEQFAELKGIVGKATQSVHVEPVSKAVNNPLIWVGFVGTLMVMIATLLIAFYNFQQNSLSEKVEAIQDNFIKVQTAQSQILEDQRLQSQSLKTLSQVITDLSATVSDMRSNRFKSTDFPVHISPFEQRLQIVEQELSRREKTVDDVRDLKSSSIESKENISLIKQRLIRLEMVADVDNK